MNGSMPSPPTGRRMRPKRPAEATPGSASGVLVGGTVAVVIVAAAVAVGAYALVRQDAWNARNTAAVERFDLDLSEQMRIPMELVRHVEQGRITLSFQESRAIAVDADGVIYVAGDQAVERLDRTGQTLGRWELAQPPVCLAVETGDAPTATRVYVGSRRQVTVWDAQGGAVSQWPAWESPALITALAVTPDGLFVADAGRRMVLQCDRDGRELRRIGQPDPDRNMPGFIIPSAHFDIATGAADTLLVVNPGMRRVETYSFDGELQSYWGRAGSAIGDFFGCCNPARIAVLSDGRLVTSETGIPRVKLYDAQGGFESVVAGPDALGVAAAALGDARGNQTERIYPVAVGPRDEILVVDSFHRCIRRFQPVASDSGERL